MIPTMVPVRKKTNKMMATRAAALIAAPLRHRCRGSSKTTPGWEYQFTAAIGHLRTAWAALLDVARTTPATRTSATIAQVKSVLRRLRAAGHGLKAAPLFIFDAGDSAAALTDGLLGCPVHLLVRLAAGSAFCADPFTWEGRYGRPARHGAAVHCLEPEDFQADAGTGPRGRKKPLPPNPEPDQALVLPGTPLYGTVRAEAWHGVHPLIHGDRGWFAGRTHLPGAARHPRPRHRRTAAGRPGPAPGPCGCGTPARPRCPSTSSGAPTSPGSTSSTPSSS